MNDTLLSRIIRSNCRRSGLENMAILIVWSGLVLYQTSVHVMWRDEVRAFSIALSGDSFGEMLRALHGEGHPAVWYLLLRSAHHILNTYLALPIVAFLVAAGAVSLLIFRSPFPRLVLIALVGSHCFLYEYSVMARNYGIAALLLFLIAALYRSWRDRGPLIGILLLLLANTNVIAAMMVAGFLLFWFLELLEERHLRWCSQWINFVLNASLATFGVTLCALTMLPTYNDAAAIDWSEISLIDASLQAITNPASTTPGTLLGDTFPAPVGSAILYLMTLVMLPKRAAFFSSLTGLVLLSIFSSIGVAGSYRHALIWFVFYVSVAWISWENICNPSGLQNIKIKNFLYYTGILAFLFYLAVQLFNGVGAVGRAIDGKSLESRTAELGALLSRKELKDAIVVPEPEFIVEALPYYVKNQIYFVRENKFGKFVRFSKSGKLVTNLGEILNFSRRLQQQKKLPVVIVITHKIRDLKPGTTYREGYNWSFSASEGQIAEFLSATRLIAEFGPVTTNENYDVYLLK